jgi:hypothetical protein
VRTDVPAAIAVIAPAEFASGKFASLFEREAYRLEVLDWYYTPETQQRLQRFLAGEQVTAEERAPWLAMVREARAMGKTMSRVHLVSEPLTDYLKYELACYRSSVEAGEEVGILPDDRAAGLDLPELDYWLFDSERAAVMVYGDRGAFLHAELVTDPAFVAKCRRWRDLAMIHAIPLGEYTARSTA